MLIAPSAFILGILSAFYWSETALLLCLLFFLLGIALLTRSARQLGLALLCLVLGFMWADSDLQSYYSSVVPVKLEGKDIVLQANIVEIPVKLHSGWRLVVDVQHSLPDTNIKLLQLNWYQHDVVPKLGESWSFTVRLKRPHGYSNPGGFDYEKWMLSRGLHGRGYIRHGGALHRPDTLNIRQSVWDSLQVYSGDAGRLIGALVLGEKHGLPYAQRQLFIDSGTAHLFAISGLHIGMVAGLLLVCAKLLLLVVLYTPNNFVTAHIQQTIYRISPLRIALLCSWLGCVAYAALAGFSLSTQRALIMLSVVYLACALRQRIFSLHSLILALVLILLVQPAAVLGVGLFLSFCAVAWIAYLLHILPRQLSNWKKALCIQLLLPLCLWPLLQFYFGSAATLGAVANIVLIPLMGFVLLPLCLLASFLEVILPLSNSWLINIIDVIYQYTLEFLQSINSVSWARPLNQSVNIFQLLLLQIAIALLLLPKGFPQPFKVVALLIMVLFCIPNRTSLREGEFKASVLDVGQGLSVLIQTKSHSLLFDTGPEYPSGFSASKAVLLPYLQDQGIDRIDTLILSHGDQDHQGGLTLLLRKIAVEKIYSGQPERIQTAVEISMCTAGQQWGWDGVEFKVLWPSKQSTNGLWSRSNNHSCVLRVTSQEQSILLTGDIEKSAEDSLLQGKAELHADMLVAPHHGSNSSSSRDFIQAVDPAHVIFSSGYRSRFGHPHEKVMQRYTEASVKQYLTAFCGLVLYTKSGLSCYREQNKQRWMMEW